MKRPLCVIGVVLLLSTGVSFFLSVEHGLLLAFAFSLTALLFWLTKPKAFFPLVVTCLAFSIGLLLGARYQSGYYHPFTQFYGSTVQIKGFVKESTLTNTSQYRYLLKAEFPELPLPKTPFVLRDYIGEEFQVGEVIHVTAKLGEPRYENTKKYYRGQGISGEAVLVETQSRTMETTKLSHKFYTGRESLRQRIYEKNVKNLPKSTAALVNGMVFGMTEDLPTELYSAMNTVGTSHLISVSGLHLSIVVGGVIWLLKKLGLRSKIVYVGGMVGAVLFTLLVGARAPMLRSCVMSLIFLLGELLQEESDSLTSLGLAAVVVCVFFPYWIFSTGMWLSFLATGGIILFGVPIVARLSSQYEKSKTLLSKVQQGGTSVLGITLGAYIFTLPLLIFISGIVPLISPVANILVSPFSTVVVVGGVLLAFIPTILFIYKPVAWLVAICGNMISGVSLQLAKLPFAGISLDNTFLVVLFGISLVLFVACFLLYKYKKINTVKVVCLSCIILLSSGKALTLVMRERQVEVIQFEESETVLLLRGSRGIILNPPNQYGMKNLLSYLSYRGVTKIEGLYLPKSKGRIDSGLLELYNSYPPKMIMTSTDPVVGQLLADFFLGIPVYLGKPNETEILGLRIIMNKNGDIVIFKDGEGLSPENYDIIKAIPKSSVVLSSGELEANMGEKKRKPLFGHRIYGEERQIFLERG